MSADPNEFLSFLLAQQQEQQQQQQQRQQQCGGAQDSSKQPLLQLYQQLVPAAPARNAAQPPPSLDALNRLVANYLQGTSRGGLNAPAPASNYGVHSWHQAFAAQGINHDQNMSTQTNTGAPSFTNKFSMHGNQRELLDAAKLLATANPGLAAAALELAMASHQKQFPKPQQQYSVARASTENEVEVAVTAGTFPINNSGKYEVLKNKVHCKSTRMPTNDRDKNNKGNMDNKSKDIYEQDNLFLASMATQQATELNGNNGVGTCSIGSLMGAAGTNRKSFRSSSPSSVPQPLGDVSLLTLQTWDLEQLESHAKKLQEMNQPIPNAVRIVLEDAREKIEKKHAKRLANRKFASTARARKKQLIDELTAANAQLRRQALILSYLPDAVVVISLDGEIKFCSTQLVRLLKYNEDDLLGLNIEDLLVPDSRSELSELVREVAYAEQRAVSLLDPRRQQRKQVEANGITSDEEEHQCRTNGSANYVDRGHVSSSSRDYSNEAPSVSRSSDQSKTLFEENFEDVDDEGACKKLSISFDDPSSEKNHTINSKNSLTTSSLTQNSSLLTAEASTSEYNNRQPSKTAETNLANKESYSAKVSFFHGVTPPDDIAFRSNTASVTANSEEYTSSNEFNSCNAHAFNVDDVMGASVTANNANAKLSSLIHVPKNETKKGDDTENPQPAAPKKQPTDVSASRIASTLLEKQGNSEQSSVSSSTHVRPAVSNWSEGSGYGESYESSDDSEQNNSSISRNFKNLKKIGKRLHPLAPSCNLLLMRSDLTTIWCEVTSSIRNRTYNDEDSELGIIDHNHTASIIPHNEVPVSEEKEILLCCRPILHGAQVCEELRCVYHSRKAVNEKKLNGHVECPLSKAEIDCTNGSPIKKRIFTIRETNFPSGESLEKKLKLSHGCTKDNLDNHQDQEIMLK